MKAGDPLSRRDAFAIAALPKLMEFTVQYCAANRVTMKPDVMQKAVCADAYAWADAMMAASNKRKARPTGRSALQRKARNANA